MKITTVLLVLVTIFMCTPCFADHVNGYYRKDGTYVQGYERSSPDEYKWNNYGPSEYPGQPPSLRDADKDGTPNMYDHDDNNDGKSDDEQ